mmetsp:Transcript_49358/g.155221  ORF Transcript_49358/g.155221 Transcript_49358/m.155221 type:complete len:224 (+) Transcript_49358:1169-1840(+)
MGGRGRVHRARAHGAALQEAARPKQAAVGQGRALLLLIWQEGFLFLQLHRPTTLLLVGGRSSSLSSRRVAGLQERQSHLRRLHVRYRRRRSPHPVRRQTPPFRQGSGLALHLRGGVVDSDELVEGSAVAPRRRPHSRHEDGGERGELAQQLLHGLRSARRGRGASVLLCRRLHGGMAHHRNLRQPGMPPHCARRGGRGRRRVSLAGDRRRRHPWHAGLADNQW